MGVCCFSVAGAVLQNQFSDTEAGLPGVISGLGVWGDFDSDGDLDAFIAGTTNGFVSGYIARVYRNDHGAFLDINAAFRTVRYFSGAWGDYDNDGDLDLALAGFDPSTTNELTTIYQNNGGDFAEVSVGLPVGSGGDVAWGDFDNDGTRDLVLTANLANTNMGGVPRVYWNNAGRFYEYTFLPRGVGRGVVACGDYDNDGNLDLLMAGFITGDQVCRILRNTGNRSFEYINAGLQGISGGAIAWGDYDRDGRLDILLAGDTAISNRSATVCRIYRNEGNGVFTDIKAGLPDLNSCSAAWGDYNNDGWLDILMSGGGAGEGGRLTRVYRNDHGSFTNYADVQGAWFGSVDWGDYDNDGHLDFLLTGYAYTPVYSAITRIYRNMGALPNRPPSQPRNLNAWLVGTNVLLAWDAASDDHTLPSNLSYDCSIRNFSRPANSLTPQAKSDGRRLVSAPGNYYNSSFGWLTSLTNGQLISWTVQALDSSYLGGEFAAEHSFIYPPPLWQGPAATISKSGSGRVEIIVSNSPPMDWQLFGSTNFQSWFSIGTTGRHEGGLIRFEDSHSSNLQKRFYQLKRQ